MIFTNFWTKFKSILNAIWSICVSFVFFSQLFSFVHTVVWHALKIHWNSCGECCSGLSWVAEQRQKNGYIPIQVSLAGSRSLGLRLEPFYTQRTLTFLRIIWNLSWLVLKFGLFPNFMSIFRDLVDILINFQAFLTYSCVFQ